MENYYVFTGYEDEPYYYEEGEIHIASHLSPMPKKLMEYVQKHYNYRMRYSKTIRDSYLANGCEFCDALQGDYFLFGEVGSPFFVSSREKAEKLLLYKIPLRYDLVLEDLEVGFGSEDWLIKKYGKGKEIRV